LTTDDLAAAKAAIEAGDYARARHHINNLSLMPGHAADVAELNMLISHREFDSIRVGGQRVGYAIAVSGLGYMLLAIQSPAGWGQPIWGLLALFALPFAVGILSGNSVSHSHQDPQKAQRFWRSFCIAAIGAAVHTLIGLAITRGKMQSADKSSDFFIYVVVATVYGCVAGLVAGMAGSIFPIARRTA